MVILKTKSAGNGYPKKAIEKTVLRFLGSRTFSHGLGREEPFPVAKAEWPRKGGKGTLASDFCAS